MTRLLTLIAVSSALVLSSCASATKKAGEGDSCCSSGKACDASSACGGGSCCAEDSGAKTKKKS
jgi:hypothetical protein